MASGKLFIYPIFASSLLSSSFHTSESVGKKPLLDLGLELALDLDLARAWTDTTFSTLPDVGSNCGQVTQQSVEQHLLKAKGEGGG